MGGEKVESMGGSNDITIELKRGYAQLDGSNFTFNV